MKEISLGALDQFGRYGGLLGMVICALIAIVIGVFFFLIWYIKSDRENKLKAQVHSSEQYEKRLREEAHLADSVAAIASSVDVLAMAIRAIPCMEKGQGISKIDAEFFERKRENNTLRRG